MQALLLEGHGGLRLLLLGGLRQALVLLELLLLGLRLRLLGLRLLALVLLILTGHDLPQLLRPLLLLLSGGVRKGLR